MARSARTARRAASKKTGVRLDLSAVGKAFEPGKEYEVKIIECTLEDGTKAPYFNLKLAGVDEDYEKSFMYHKASTSESSLWRLRPLMEAFGMDILDGPMDISPDDFVGLTAMCSTYLERWDGGSSVRPDEFWPSEGGSAADDDEDEDEKPVKKSKGKAVVEDDDEDEDEKPARKSRRSKAKPVEDDEDEDEPAPKGRKSRKAPVEDDDEEEEQPKSKAKGKAKKKAGVSEDELNEMNEDELEDLIEQHDLDVDLADHKTLRKKRNAVLDALEEAGLLD
jgi:hypothetical protein